MRRLSDRQKGILRFIEEHVAERGYAPSYREIGNHVGISSTSVVDYNLRVLERDGRIFRDPMTSRGIGLVNANGRWSRQLPTPRTVRVPLVGRIAAGLPIEAIAEPDETFEFAYGSVPSDAYALRVVGSSMIDDHIEDGDLVIIRPQPTVEDGEIAVAIVDDGLMPGATLKRFYRAGEMVRLEPRNRTMQPLVYPAAKVEVQGEVIRLLREM